MFTEAEQSLTMFGHT